MNSLYFDQKEPKKEEVQPKRPEEVTPPSTDDKKLILIRTKQTGDKVYRVNGNTVHWVMNPQVLEAIQGSFEDIDTVPYEILTMLEKGVPISMQNYNEFIIPKDEN
jgi:hypothetical protein